VFSLKKKLYVRLAMLMSSGLAMLLIGGAGYRRR